jgi:2-oxoglutarate ferredoxin oxidoreductase subunit alpha
MVKPNGVDDFVIGMAGSGGDGIVSAGEVLIGAAAREGYYAIMTKSFGSQVRGGESSCRVRLATRRIYSPGGALDVAIALNWVDFLKFGAELPVSHDTIVIYDTQTEIAANALPLETYDPSKVMPVPITELARSSTAGTKGKNAIVLGLLVQWFGLNQDTILEALERKLSKKSRELFAMNELAFHSAANYAKANPIAKARLLEPPAANATPKLLADGNDMTAAAAIYAGCEFFGGYPITPSTEIMQLFTRQVWQYGGSVLQAEDEIAGIGAALGASFAGKKAMTATSGPGMALKAEIMGLATITELPLVIVDVQRGGPSTGIPTKPEQSDLLLAAFSAHGDVLRPVLAPTSVAESAAITIEAFNIAERYQTPVIILSDQEIGQRKETVDQFDPSKFTIEQRRLPVASELENYARFAQTDDYISPVSYPGMVGGNYQAAGIEHDSKGSPNSSGLVHAAMNEKRFKKLAPLTKRRDLFQIEGDPSAPLALMAWGSVAGMCREARTRAAAEGIAVKLFVPQLLYPIAEDVYREFFASVTAGLFVELSHQGQLYRILRMFVDVPSGIESYCRSGANPFQPGEIVERLRALAVSQRASSATRQKPATTETEKTL